MNAFAPPIGSFIAGKYRVERVLGSGGMAVVVEATHLVLGQRVAIKLLRGDVARAPGVLERFRQEAQIAAQLPGDHVVRVTDIGLTERGEAFLVMELLIGRDLEAEILARGWMPMEEAVDVILQACEGVAEAHAKGLVHRDLKPGNLFFMRRRDGSPLIKVLDFGISKLMTRQEAVSLTQTSSNFGTPLYMSPEQIQSVKHVDARCDQHALGAILYTLLAGQPPYNAPSVTALSVLIATQPPASLRSVRPDIPARLEDVILRTLAKAPGDRFPDLAAFAYALVPFGSAGAQASVRRITSALASSMPPPNPSLSGVPAASPSSPGHGGPTPELSLGSLSDPGLVSPVNSHINHISGMFASPGRASEPSGSSPPFGPARASVGQTSAAVTTALGGDASASSRRMPMAIAFVSVTALCVALLVGVVLFYFGPKRNADAAPASASEGSPSAAVAVDPPPVVSAAPDSLAPTAPAPEAPPPAAEAPLSASASPSASPAPTASSVSTAPSAPVVAAPPPAPPKSWPPPARPASTGAKPATTKKRDPSEVFGAKR
jgi:serine/threonine-protein kinase